MSVQFGPGEGIDYAALQKFAAQSAQEKLKTLEGIVQNFPNLVHQKEALENLKITLQHTIKAVEDDKSDPTQAKIAGAAKQIITQIDKAKKQKEVFREVASHAEPKIAKSRLQKMLDSKKSKEFLLDRQNILVLREAKLKKQKAQTVELLQSYRSQVDKLEKSKNFFNKAKINNEIITLQPTIFDLESKVYKYNNPIRIVANELDEINTKLKAMDASPSAAPLKPLAAKSLNPVYITSEGAFKQEPAELDTRAHFAAGLLGAAGAVVPSIAADVRGALETKAGARLEMASGLIQPLIAQKVNVADVFANPYFSSQILNSLDVADTQQKAVMQSLLGSWDLHQGNALFTPSPNLQYEKCEEEKNWEYQALDGSWKKVESFFELVVLKCKGAISETTKVRSTIGEGDKSVVKERTMQDDADLKAACNTKWKLLFFDNERTLGGQRTPATGNHNEFQVWNGNACLPIRSFLLALDVSHAPLKPEIREWILGHEQRKPFLEKALFEGNHALWRKLSDATAKELRQFFQGTHFFYPQAIADGASKEPLLAQLPVTLLRKVLQDLEQSKVIPGRLIEPSKNPVLLETIKKHGKDIKDLLLLLEIAARGIDISDFKVKALALIEHCDNCTAEGAIVDALEAARFKELNQVLTTAIHEIASRLGRQLSDAMYGQLMAFIQNTSKRAETINRLLLAPSLENCKKLLVENLFPRIDPSESVALLERIDNAVSYMKRAGDTATIAGVNNAMFPYFDPMIDLMAKLSGLERSLSGRQALIREIVRQKAAFSQDAAKLSQCDVAIATLKNLDVLSELQGSILGSDQFSYDGWNKGKADALIAIINRYGAMLEESAVEDKKKQQWKEAAPDLIKAIQLTLSTPFTENDHKELLGTISEIIKSEEKVLVDALGLQNLVSPQAIQAAQNSGAIAPPDLKKVKEEILLEYVTLPNGYGYCFEPCKDVLDSALNMHLFEGGQNNPIYKQLTKALNEIRPR